MLPMNVKKNWDELSERLRGRFSKIKESDVVFIEGRYDEMLEKISLRMGRSKAEVQKLIDSMNTEAD
jgi:hypothetical protein